MKNAPFVARARRGFTLVEILVVIGILALLSALTFPVFSRVREGGRTSVCSSNLRQLGIAFQQYVQDNQRYPYAGNYQAWGPGLGHWVAGTRSMTGLASDSSPFTRDPAMSTANVEAGAIYSYVKSPAIYVCPSTKDSESKKLGYSMNCSVALVGPARLRTPSEVILLVDEGQSLNDGYFWAVASTTNPLKNTDELTQVHNGGGNLLFCDGHVDFYTFNALPLKAGANDLKTRTSGSPRFRDLAFGPNGVSTAGAAYTVTGTGSTPTIGDPSCFASS